MDMRERVISGFALSVAVSVLAGGVPVGFISDTAQAQQIASADVNAQQLSAADNTQRAQAFFANLATQNDNPIIQAMAKQSLARLKTGAPAAPDPDSASAGHGDRQIEVSTIMQQNSSLAVPTLVNGKTMATFLVDTGASYTVITPRMAQKLGVVITPDTPRISMATANGVVQAPLVTLDKIAIGQVEVQNVKVVVQPLGGANDILLAGLLGMNFFKNMDLTVRQNKLVLDIHDE